MIIEVNKKYFIVLASLLIILTGTILVYTYGGTSPSTIGHTLGELQCGSSNCDANVDGKIDQTNIEMPCTGSWQNITAGEDSNGSVINDFNAWRYGVDTCDGNKNIISLCNPNFGGSCDDFYTTVTGCDEYNCYSTYSKVVRTCKIAKGWVCG